MKIGIIGSGKVGRALGAWAAKAGHSVSFASRNKQHGVEAAESAGHEARALDIPTLVMESELLFLTLPYGEITNALEPCAELLRAKTIVDVTNPITPDRRDLTIGHLNSGAEEISRHFPQANVVKAFNAVFTEV